MKSGEGFQVCEAISGANHQAGQERPRGFKSLTLRTVKDAFLMEWIVSTSGSTTSRRVHPAK